MPRGITDNDVFTAANSVLARGERPTIERVRSELGRGSPNTINRLLDAWWSQLAARMSAVEGQKLPSSLVAAVDQVYQLALAEASEAAEKAVTTREATLDAQLASLSVREREMTSREAGFKASAEALREELARTTDAAAESSAERATLRTELAAERKHSGALEAQIKGVRKSEEERASRDAADLARARSQAQLAEDRLLRQIDALRTDVKTLKAEKIEMSKRRDREVASILGRLTESQRAASVAEHALTQANKKLHDQELRLAKIAPKTQLSSESPLSSNRSNRSVTGRRQSPARIRSLKPARNPMVSGSKVVTAEQGSPASPLRSK